MNNRGYFGIGIYNPKTIENVGTLWRAAFSFGASFIFTIGKRYKNQSSDTSKTYRHIPFIEYPTYEYFKSLKPKNSLLVAIENSEGAIPIQRFYHPERAIYILGSEDKGLPNEIISECDQVIILPGKICHNVAVSGAMVMFDRLNKGSKSQII